MSANPYYPVTTSSDSAQLTDEDWGLSFTSGKRQPRESRFKSFCQKTQGRPKCIIIGFVSIVVLLFICVIIIAAASKSSKNDVPQKHPTGSEAARVEQTMGVNFYPIPEDKTILLSFKPHHFTNDEAIKKSMDTVLSEYDSTDQQGPEFTMCNGTYAPYNKACYFSKINFGQHCSFHNDYGYNIGEACVLLQLELPGNRTIRQLPEDSDLLTNRSMPEVVHPDYIPITCQGSTDDDESVLHHLRRFGKFNNYEVFPEEGFQSFFYRPRDTGLPFVKPAAMLWFPNLPHKHLLHITCTAWGQVYDFDDNLVKHPLLQTTFAFYMNFGEPN